MAKALQRAASGTEGKSLAAHPEATGGVAEGGVEVEAGERTIRRNRRSESTIAGILATTEEIILRSGADRISILEVCEMAGISRGTFYRYFSSQEELLEAFATHKRERFHKALLEATAPYNDPDERFDALIRHLDDYLEFGRARRLLVVAPEYAIGWFNRILHDSIERFQDVLRIVFDAWDARLGIKIDRELVCEMMIRFVLSDMLVPSGPERRELPKRIGALVSSLVEAQAQVKRSPRRV